VPHIVYLADAHIEPCNPAKVRHPAVFLGVDLLAVRQDDLPSNGNHNVYHYDITMWSFRHNMEIAGAAFRARLYLRVTAPTKPVSDLGAWA
tara:strand:- start:9566 stop:9838 length:273 start_codon:yes stop_codon:yes gene_type:complete